MTSQNDLTLIRRVYARQIVDAARVDDPRLEAAFADVERERFLGPAPWELMRFPETYQVTPDADPLFVYQDVPISILADKRLNNGQPSFLAMLIGLCAVRPRDQVVHVGTGTGYYTAVLARLVQPGGQVLGIEFEADLARRAMANLGPFATARVVHGDGWTHPLPPADAILVNAGTPRPAATWLDALKPGGRLVLPLCVPGEADGLPVTRGMIFLITRDEDGFAASGKYRTLIYPCHGGSDPDAETALAAAFEAGGAEKVTRLRREPVADDSRCWLRGHGWSLTYD